MYSAFNYDVLNNPQKKSEIKCETCNKIFCSDCALRGHQRMHSTKRSFMVMLEAEVHGDVGSKPWFVEKQQHQHEATPRCSI